MFYLYVVTKALMGMVFKYTDGVWGQHFHPDLPAWVRLRSPLPGTLNLQVLTVILLRELSPKIPLKTLTSSGTRKMCMQK